MPLVRFFSLHFKTIFCSGFVFLRRHHHRARTLYCMHEPLRSSPTNMTASIWEYNLQRKKNRKKPPLSAMYCHLKKNKRISSTSIFNAQAARLAGKERESFFGQLLLRRTGRKVIATDGRSKKKNRNGNGCNKG